VIGGENPADQRTIVTVAYIGKNSVRLGIEAPEGVEVHREEVQRKIDGEKGGDADDCEASDEVNE